jgi:nicotinamide-nucleotide amidase
VSAQQDATERLIAALVAQKLTIAVAESLTGGLLTAELVRIPGVSAVLCGGVVAYQTELKRTLLGVDAALLAEHGAVHPEVARQMATGVRTALAVDGRPADIGVATTGVAGPHDQDGQAVGTVYLGVAFGDTVRATPLRLSGDRSSIRAQSVEHAIEAVCQLLEKEKQSISE